LAATRTNPTTAPDGAGHDLRYAIDSTTPRDELGWRPGHTNFDDALRDYRLVPGQQRVVAALKDAVEAEYVKCDQ
jgi:dTDP-glucose 4,6-dehydratase